MRQVKAYVELHNYEEIPSHAAADRVVSSFFVTQTVGIIAAQLITDLAAPRTITNDAGAASLQVIAGQRGVGKSHLLSFLRILISQRQLRALVSDPTITHALGQLSDRSPIVIEINFAGHEQDSFEQRLRESMRDAYNNLLSFTDEQWQHAVASDQVFEQALRALPVDAQLIFFIDNLSRRWEVAPERTKDDLDWLGLITRQSKSLPLRAVIVRDEESPADGITGTIYHLPPNHLKEVVTRRVLYKTPQHVEGLGELYRELNTNLPNFDWSAVDFTAAYPLHPLIFDLAPILRSLTSKFSLPAFASAATARAANHPAVSLVVLDEVFDRYEYELRKNADIAPSFAAYDLIVSEGVMKLPVMERLWAKLVAKAVLLLALAGREITPVALAQAQLLFEPGDPPAGIARINNILTHIAKCCPTLLSAEAGSSVYRLTPPQPDAEFEAQLSQSASLLSFDHPETAREISELLIALGGSIFSDWNISAVKDETLELKKQDIEIVWRGSLRPVELGVHQNTFQSYDARRSPHTWQIEIIPLHLSEAEIRLANGFIVRWFPGKLTNETSLKPLKMLLALEQARAGNLANAQFSDNIYEKLREKFTAQIRELFTDLYLTRGSFVELLSGQRKARPILTEASELASSLRAFLATELSKSFSHVFPAHPDFPVPLESAQVKHIVTKFFAQTETATKDPALQQLAAQYALPLGLVSQTTDEGGASLYKLDIFRGTNTPHPLVQGFLNFIDGQAEQNGLASVPLAEVFRFLSGIPYGLTPPLTHLLIGGLVASGLVALGRDNAEATLSAGNLHVDFEISNYTSLCRVSSADYPQEVLAEWGRQLTGHKELPPPINQETIERTKAAFKEWLATWEPEKLALRFEKLPIELITVSHWRAMHTSRQRFSRVHALADAAVRGQMPFSTALSRIADVFGFDLEMLSITQSEMRSLSEFLDWVPTLDTMRDYLLASEPTAQDEIESLRLELSDDIQSSHRLIDPSRRESIEAKFAEFKRRYSDFYAAAHESHVGPSASRELIKSFCESNDWQQFCLLLHLKLDDGAFHRDTQVLLSLAVETRCDLPIAELLLQQPHCCCSFRLHRRLHLGSLLDALKSVVNAALTYYSLALWRRREEIRAQAVKLDEDHLTSEIEGFLSACGNGDLSRISPDLVRAINRCLADTPADNDEVRFMINSAPHSDSLSQPT